MIGSTRFEIATPGAKDCAGLGRSTARLNPAGNESSVISNSWPTSWSRVLDERREEPCDSSTCKDGVSFFMNVETRGGVAPDISTKRVGDRFILDFGQLDRDLDARATVGHESRGFVKPPRPLVLFKNPQCHRSSRIRVNFGNRPLKELSTHALPTRTPSRRRARRCGRSPGPARRHRSA